MEVVRTQKQPRCLAAVANVVVSKGLDGIVFSRSCESPAPLIDGLSLSSTSEELFQRSEGRRHSSLRRRFPFLSRITSSAHYHQAGCIQYAILSGDVAPTSNKIVVFP